MNIWIIKLWKVDCASLWTVGTPTGRNTRLRRLITRGHWWVVVRVVVC